MLLRLLILVLAFQVSEAGPLLEGCCAVPCCCTVCCHPCFEQQLQWVRHQEMQQPAAATNTRGPTADLPCPCLHPALPCLAAALLNGPSAQHAAARLAGPPPFMCAPCAVWAWWSSSKPQYRQEHQHSSTGMCTQLQANGCCLLF